MPEPLQLKTSGEKIRHHAALVRTLLCVKNRPWSLLKFDWMGLVGEKQPQL